MEQPVVAMVIVALLLVLLMFVLKVAVHSAVIVNKWLTVVQGIVPQTYASLIVEELAV